jgi:hypothetical protein
MATDSATPAPVNPAALARHPRCLSCGYDLTATNGSTRLCPECGTSYSKEASIGYHRGSIQLTLKIVAWSAIGFSVAQVLALSLPFLSATLGSDRSAFWAVVEFIPGLTACFGIGILGLGSGETPWRKLWPLLAAVLYAFTLWHSLLADAMRWYARPEWWMPESWTGVPRIRAVALGLLLIAGATGVRRENRPCPLKALHSATTLLITLAVALVIEDLLRQACSIQVRPTPGAQSVLWIWVESILTQSNEILGLLGWISLALLALYARVWFRERDTAQLLA